jgi:hypothetical protein
MRTIRKTIAWISFLATTLVAGRAGAIPAFARKTGMGCPACHDAWPRLNDFGELYRDRGYRLGNVDDDVFAHVLDNVPVSFRTTVGYQGSVTTHQATDTGDQTISTGGFQFPAADVYFGTALSNHATVYTDLAGFSKDGTVRVESAWARINDIGTNWLNLKLGVLEQDLPISMHRSYSIFAPFLIYGFHPPASTNGLNMGENQLAIELMGHEKGPGLRYAISLGTSSDVMTASPLSAPSLYGHVTYTELLRSPIVPRVRVGAFGLGNWWPTTFMMLTTNGMSAAVPGTGSGHKPAVRAGGDVQLVFGSLGTPLTLTAVWMYGQEDAALIPSATRAARFHGGLVQLDYTPLLELTLGVRYDGVFNIQQADPTMPDNSNEQNAISFFGRYAIWMAAWGSLMVHTEVSTVKTENAAMTPTNPVRNTFVFAGIDLLL